LLESEIFDFFDNVLKTEWVDQAIKSNILFIVGNVKFSKHFDAYLNHQILETCLELSKDHSNKVLKVKAIQVFINLVA